MKLIKRIDLKNLIRHIKSEGLSMRWRFILYAISAIALVLSLIVLLLNIFGILNPAKIQLMNVLDTQLSSYAYNIEHEYDKIAAHAISFSEQLEADVQSYLTANKLSFQDLTNNAEALTELQQSLYDTVFWNMQLSPCSGAFYILNTTVNTHSDISMKNGIYLKYINLYSENTVNNKISLYRGSFSTAKEHNIIFHSGWQNEILTDFFDDCDKLFTEDTHYILSETTPIPETWERARYVYVPIRDYKEQIIGVCGFEVNDLYFQLVHKTTDTQPGNFICALLDEQTGKCSGQFNSSHYNTADFDNVDISTKRNTTIFDFGKEKCIGKYETIHLGNNNFIIALMMPELQYNSYLKQGQQKTAIIILLVTLFAFAFCFFMSKKYVSPILSKIEQIKTNGESNEQLKIREIDDLFAFLEEKDTVYEKQLSILETEKQIAEEEAEKTKAAYEKAMAKYTLAQNEIQQLSEDRKKEIVLEDYEYFICNLNTLTPTEYRIYELYLDGNSASDIAKCLNITENTMKYHNKNIYSKLGISSRKQLIRYATLKQHQDNKQNKKD